MLIRSQDKKSLVNLSQVTELCIYNNRIYADFQGENQDTIIGEYFTKEKAMNVLDKITQEYLNSNKEFEKDEEGWSYIKSAYVANIVYQMPQDSEV